MSIPYCELVYQMLTHILQRQGSEEVGVLTHWEGWGRDRFKGVALLKG